jgi:hypothetical protein
VKLAKANNLHILQEIYHLIAEAAVKEWAHRHLKLLLYVFFMYVT